MSSEVLEKRQSTLALGKNATSSVAYACGMNSAKGR